MSDLALAIDDAVVSGASLINLSLAILGEDGLPDEALAVALDRAEAAGAIVMAADNQGRLAASQTLSHPVTIPVVAVDAAGSLLPDCNFGPLISRKGVSALGDGVRGYGPDGGVTLMSGTSVATAVATGIVAQIWSARPNVGGATMHAGAGGSPPTRWARAAQARRERLIGEARRNSRFAFNRIPHCVAFRLVKLFEIARRKRNE